MPRVLHDVHSAPKKEHQAMPSLDPRPPRWIGMHQCVPRTTTLPIPSSSTTRASGMKTSKWARPRASPNLSTAIIALCAQPMLGLQAFTYRPSMPIIASYSPVLPCSYCPWPVAICCLASTCCLHSMSLVRDCTSIHNQLSFLCCIALAPRESVLEGEGVRQRFTSIRLTLTHIPCTRV